MKIFDFSVTRLPRQKVLQSITFILLSFALIFTSTNAYANTPTSVTAPLPVTEGEIFLTGINKPVTVWRDEKGVPHIEAKEERDLFFAQGYITASERLFQMDLLRRQASGQLSEIFGESQLGNDKFFRTFGLRRAAQTSYRTHSAHARKLLDSYAQGVTTFINQAKAEGKLPIEFTMLGYEPAHWTSVDSLSIFKYMAYDLSQSWTVQAFYYHLHQKYPDEQAFDLYPTYPSGRGTILNAIKNNPIDIEKNLAQAVLPNRFNGSNNWVLSGDKTESGKPILANDPHLTVGAPSIWFEAHLKGARYEVSGVSIPGVPAIAIGSTPHIAWGMTNVNPDVQDLYIEKRNPNNPYQFEYKGKWESAQTLTEEIKVRGKASVSHEIVITRHGPIISEFARDEKPETALAVRWTAHQPTAEMDAVLDMAYAKTFNQFTKALKKYSAPAQNFVFASKDGDIGYRANGLIPIRNHGKSLVPVPGWTDEYEWKSFIPFDKLPTAFNPAEGFIATANNKVIDESKYPYHITDSWAAPYRYERIAEVLRSKEKHSVQDMQQLQMDQKNLKAQEFLPIFFKHLQSSEQQAKLRPQDKAALALLKEWDYVDRVEQGAPLIFSRWTTNMFIHLLVNDLGEPMARMFSDAPIVMDQLIRKADAGKPGPWMQAKGGLPAVALTSLQMAVDQVTAKQGEDLSKWNWGKEHFVTFEHPLSELDPSFTPVKIPVGGSANTVQASGASFITGIVNHSAPWRRVIDMADTSQSYNLLGPGQSGHVMSKWYADQAEDWVKGVYHTTSTNPDVYRKTTDKLSLLPAGK